VGPGSEHDSKKLTTLIEELTAKPTELYADSAYDTEHIRSTLNQMDIQANIPVNPRNGRKPKPYNQTTYKKCSRKILRIDQKLQKNNNKIRKASINIQSPSNHSIHNHPPKTRNLEMSSLCDLSTLKAIYIN